MIRTLAEVELLHIEDLRVVRPTEWVLEQLYLIVNTRYEERRSIVFTSDIDSDEDGPLEPNPAGTGEAHRHAHVLATAGDVRRSRGDHGYGQAVGLRCPRRSSAPQDEQPWAPAEQPRLHPALTLP